MERPWLHALPTSPATLSPGQCFHLLAQSSNHPSVQLGCVQHPPNNPKILTEKALAWEAGEADSSQSCKLRWYQ